MLVLKSIINVLVNPLNIMGILCFLICLFLLRGKRKNALRTVYALMGFFFLTATGPIPNLLIGHLEQKYQSIELDNIDTSATINILVLGSGHVADPDLPSSGQLVSSSLSRLNEGLRIRVHVGKKGHLVLSGYGNKSSRSQAEVMADAAQELTHESIIISRLSEPSNTAEEAHAYIRKFNIDDPLILVTSAAHMPRAMSIFQRRGLFPIPAPTDFMIRRDPTAKHSFRLFSAQNFVNVQASLHEYVGSLWERCFVKV